MYGRHRCVAGNQFPEIEMFKRNQAVTVTSATGRTETGRIVKQADMGDRPVDRDWYIVRLDLDGSKLCIAVTSLQPR